MDLLIIIGLTLLNGVFSMSEMSLVSSRKFKLEAAKKRGNSGAKLALELSENPNKFLSTVQIGITLIGILLGVYSGENLTRGVEDFLSQIALIQPYAHSIAVAVIVMFVTYLSIVLGELLPKRLGLTFPEPIAILLARPMWLLSIITSPFVLLLTKTNDFLLNILGIKQSMDGKVTEEEIKSIIKESAEGGEIQDIEHNIVERVFELGDRKVKSLITHRSDLVYFDETDDFETIKKKINAEKHSAYPVCKNSDLDNVRGMVFLKDLFSYELEKGFTIKKVMKSPLFVNENIFAYKLLETFKKEKMHYAIVIDEYGSTKGIVTMDDVVDALVGDASEHNQEEYEITQRDENSWLVDGQYSIVEFTKYFDIELEEFDNDFVTVAGLFIEHLEKLPQVGDSIKVADLQLEIMDKDGQRIDKILVTKN